MRDRIRVYIAGPISNGGTADAETRLANVRKAIDVFLRLTELGYAPLAPQLTEWIEILIGRRIAHATWMAIDLPWVEACELLFRMEGPSTGADLEVAHARRHGVPVVFSFEELSELMDAGDDVEGLAEK